MFVAQAYIQRPLFQMSRYVAMNNRIMGGFLITMQRFGETDCTSRFSTLTSICVDRGKLTTESYGLDAVRILAVPPLTCMEPDELNCMSEPLLGGEPLRHAYLRVSQSISEYLRVSQSMP